MTRSAPRRPGVPGAALPSPRRRQLLQQAWLAPAAALGLGQARAQSSGGEALRLGASLPLSGEWATLGQAVAQGAQAALAGASHKGRPLQLQVLDDAGLPAQALKNAQTLAADPTLLALLGSWGADCNLALLPVLEAHHLPLVGPATGSEALRDSGSRWCFAVRAGVGDEAARLIIQLDHQGLNDIALVHGDDSYSRDALAALQLEITRLAMRPVATVALSGPNPSAAQLEAALAKVSAAQPHAVVVASSTPVAASFIKRWTANGFKAALAVLADTGAGLYPLLGASARGMAVSQVWPSPWRASRPLVRDYQAALRAVQPGGASAPTPDPQRLYSYLSFEGWFNAQLLLRALQRTPRDPNREQLLAALEGPEFDLDGLVLKYGRQHRRGLKFSEMTVLSAEGLLRR